MRRQMIDLGRERGPLGIHMINTTTAVDCGSREVGLRRSLRSLLDCIVPACFQPQSPSSTTFSPDSSSSSSSSSSFSSDNDSPSSSSTTATVRSSSSSSSTTVKGTFFGQRNGRVSFCLQQVQDDTNQHHQRQQSSSFSTPLLLLEFGVPTCYLAKEMQHGILRITLVEEEEEEAGSQRRQPTGIFGVPVWSMYCNGRKVGFATRRNKTAADVTTLTRMQSVSVGAGVLPPQDNSSNDFTMYLRANFRRVVGSPESQSFYMINPDRITRSSSSSSSSYHSNTTGQELSIFLLRSSS